MGKLRAHGQRNCFAPYEIYDETPGVRPSVARILDLVDVNDPSFGKVASVLSDMVAAGVELDAAAVQIALKMGGVQSPDDGEGANKVRRAPANLGLPLWGEDANQYSIVYYIQRGPLIKIGTTTDPRKRFRDLVPDEILAFEPGDRNVETFRHDQFGYFRKGSLEYFQPVPALKKHIKRIRTKHGEPDPGWITTGNVGEMIPALSRILKRPDSPDVASAAAIARKLGIKANTVRVWAHRGLLKPIAGSRPNRPLYFVDQARQLARDSAEWSESRSFE